MEAYLQFGRGNEPRQTIAVPVKESPMWWHNAGRTYTASGYGRRIPSRYMVQWEGRWRRVYICQYSNAGSAYIGPSRDWLAAVDIWPD